MAKPRTLSGTLKTRNAANERYYWHQFDAFTKQTLPSVIPYLKLLEMEKPNQNQAYRLSENQNNENAVLFPAIVMKENWNESNGIRRRQFS
jgi:hypothetical protein